MKREFKFKLDSGEVITAYAPKLCVYKELQEAKNNGELIKAVAKVLSVNERFVYDKFTTDDIRNFYVKYLAWICGEKDSDPN